MSHILFPFKVFRNLKYAILLSNTLQTQKPYRQTRLFLTVFIMAKNIIIVLFWIILLAAMLYTLRTCIMLPLYKLKHFLVFINAKLSHYCVLREKKNNKNKHMERERKNGQTNKHYFLLSVVGQEMCFVSFTYTW